MTNSSMGFNVNENSGGGYIDQLSVAKSRAIKLPLNLNREWNEGVNKCESHEELFYFIGQSDNENGISKIDEFNGLF